MFKFEPKNLSKTCPKILISMATLNLTILPHKVLKDGRHKVRIAVSHKQQTSYILTNVVIDSETQFRNGQVVRRPDASLLNRKLRNLLNEYQDRLDGIKHQALYTCIQLKEILINSNGPECAATFQSISASYERELSESGSVGYAKMLERNCRYFTEFCRGDILLADITPEMIENYSRFLRVKKGVGDTTNSMMMRNTKTVINRGVKKRVVSYEVHPFVNFQISAAPVRQVDLPLEVFNRLRLAEPTEKRYRVARDLFCLSFYLGGINLVDLMQIDFRGLDVLEYVRTKSRSTTHGQNVVSFAIPEPAKEIIKRWMNRNTGRLDFGYKFSYSNFSRYLSRLLASFSRSLGITEKVVYYSARKSFAQYASEIGIPDGVIDYCLGHSDKSKGVLRYYTRVRRQQADMAIQRVIEYVNNPELYKEYVELRQDIMMMRIG